MNNGDIDWKEYYDVTKGRAARDITLEALRHVSTNLPKIALDLGAGAGNETLDLLARGWKVYVIDSEKEAIDLIESKVPSEYRTNVELIHADFEEISIPPNSLLIANYSIPFVNPDKFEGLWNKICEAITSGGIFAGHLFGDNDEWAETENYTFHSRKEVEKLLEAFEIIRYEEEEGTKKTATGEMKYWHIHHIIIRKK